jgi:hypothetical protein
MMVEKIFKSQGRGWGVNFPAVKSSLYLTEYLPGGQLSPVLWRWHVGLLSQKKTKTTYVNGFPHHITLQRIFSV